MAILHLVLRNDANGFEDGLVPLQTMTKPVLKDIIVLEATVESLVTSTSSSLEVSDLLCVLAVSDGADGVLVGPVGNHFLAGRDLALESVWSFENRKIVLCSSLRTVNPYNLI
jgi:hypothetical protein